MREFMRRGIQKSSSMNEAQLRTFVKLMASEYSLLDSMMDSLNDGVVVADSENKIVKSNRAAERILESHLSDNQEKKRLGVYKLV
nr:PAS domain-containing protein [Treponema putidum]